MTKRHKFENEAVHGKTVNEELTTLDPKTPLRVIGFSQRMVRKSKPDKDGRTEWHSHHGDVYPAEKFQYPESGIRFGTLEIVEEETSSEEGKDS